MKIKTECIWWVRIHRSCVKTDKDAIKLHNIQSRHKANYNTETARSMWFDFPSKKHAIGFVNNITSSIPYLKITMGNTFIKSSNKEQ